MLFRRVLAILTTAFVMVAFILYRNKSFNIVCLAIAIIYKVFREMNDNAQNFMTNYIERYNVHVPNFLCTKTKIYSYILSYRYHTEI